MTDQPIWQLANPLPQALHHYQRQVAEVLEAAGIEVAAAEVPGIEIAGGSRWLKLRLTMATLMKRVGGTGGSTLVLWPVFGLADPASWMFRPGRVCLIVHDPAPLRDQHGMGHGAARLGRLAARRQVEVIVHTELAAAELADHKWRTRLVPHPIRRPEHGVYREGDQLVVLGQWKPARSMQPLEQLARLTEWDGRRQVVGRGWPQIVGWSVDSRFVTEEEMTDWIDRAACVVLPYDHYFQSNVSVRALERLRPVVGRRHEFLINLFGPDWPGVVEDEDWAGAIARVCALGSADLASRRAAYWERCLDSWRDFVRPAR